MTTELLYIQISQVKHILTTVPDIRSDRRSVWLISIFECERPKLFRRIEKLIRINTFYLQFEDKYCSDILIRIITIIEQNSSDYLRFLANFMQFHMAMKGD